MTPRSGLAQWWSRPLLTARFQVRVLSPEPVFERRRALTPTPHGVGVSSFLRVRFQFRPRERFRDKSSIAIPGPARHPYARRAHEDEEKEAGAKVSDGLGAGLARPGHERDARGAAVPRPPQAAPP